MKLNDIDSATGLCKLNVMIWKPEGAPEAVMQIVHGMAEHIDRYDEMAKYLASEGILVVGADIASHGKSREESGTKGYFGEENGWTALVEDIRSIYRAVKKEYPSIPYVLFGHSMGSFLARTYASRCGEDMDGFIFCGTAGKNSAIPIAKLIAKSEIKKHGSKAPSERLNDISFGTYNKAFRPNRTDFDWLSKNTENVDRYVADDECGYVFTAAAFRDLFDGLTEINAREWPSRVPNKPILVIAGENDPVGSMGKGPKRVAAALSETGHDVIFKLYDDMRHEICNETGKEAVWKDIEAFILAV